MTSVCGLSREKSFILVPKHAALSPHLFVFWYFAQAATAASQPLSVTPYHIEQFSIPYATHKKQSSCDLVMRVNALQAYKAVGLLFVIPRMMEVVWSKHEAQRLGGVSHTGAG